MKMIKLRLVLVLFLFMIVAVYSKTEIKENEKSFTLKKNDFDDAIENNINFVFGIDEFDKSRFEIHIYESIIDTQSTNFSSAPVYNFHYAGIQRGLKIASLDVKLIRTNPLTSISYKVDSLAFTYRFLNTIPKNSNLDVSFFTYILNKNQIGSLIYKKSTKKLNHILSKTDWFNTNQKYYKFYATKDGIARINQTQLIDNDGSLIGKKVANLQIYNRGHKIKFYSNTNSIQYDGYIYFVSSHAKGDTSYYDFYNGKEPYFITYNTDDTSEMYKLIDNNVSGNKLENVEIDNHYEKDNIYGNGVNILETEQVLCENWYQGELRVQNDFNHAWEYFTNFTLFPTSKLNIDYEYASNIYYLPETVYNKTLFKINNQSFDTVSNIGSSVINRDVVINNQNLLYGTNTLNLNSYKVVEDNKGDKFNGIIGFDYYNIKGNVLPIAENNYFSFFSDNNINTNVEVSGFENNLVVSIDTVNNTIQFPLTQNSNLLSMDNINEYSSIYFNKAIYNSHNYGYHIVTDFGKLNRTNYFKDENEFILFLDNVKDFKNIAIIINTENNISDKLKSKIQQKFSSNFINTANKKYLLAIINNKIYESINNRIFNKNVDGNYFSAIINLPKGEKSRKIVCSKPYLEDIKLQEAKLKLIPEGDYDAFYVYHPIFEPTIDNYIKYISSKENKKILKIDVEQLYDTYGYGIENPHSIKNFLQIAYNEWNKFPEFLTIVGDATWDPKMQKEGSFVEQLIPVYGIPYTDNFYGTLDGNDLIPELVIGRIPCNTEQEFENYFEKVKTFYEVPLSPWMKNVLQISGGDENQKESFTEIMQALNTLFNSSNICFDTTLVSKTTNSTVSEEKADEIKAELNKGKIWTNFLGHGSPSVIDMSGWEAPNLNNQGKYGVLNTLSCNTSAFAEPSQYNSIGEEYVNIKDKGTLATIGGTSTTEVGVALSVSSSMFFTFLNKNKPERNIGRIYNSFKARNTNSPPALNQVVLLGDPLISLRIPIQPELLLYKKDISITSEYNNSIINENDTLAKVKFIVYNLGEVNKDSIDIRIIHSYKDNNDTTYVRIEPLCFHKNLEFNIPLKNAIGEHKLNINIDYNKQSNDVNFDNNVIDVTFNVFSQGILPIEPLDNWNVSSLTPTFRFVNPTKTPKDYDFKIFDESNNLVFSNSSPKIYENYIELKADNLTPNKNYELKYFTKELNSGITSDSKEISFHTLEQIDSVVHYVSYNNNNTIKYKNLKLDNNKLVFDDKDYSVLLSSARGSSSGAERHSIINTYDKSNNNKEFRYINRLRRGFDLVIIPDLANDTNIVNIQFDTWESLNPDFDIFEDSRRLDRYLNDSLPFGYYLLLATADVPMRAPGIIENEKSPDSLGSTSRIIKALKKLGAKNADSLGFNSSYVLFTRIGYPEKTLDKHLSGDTIQLRTDFTRYQQNANINIANIGNIKRFLNGNVELTSRNINATSSILSKTSDILYQTNDLSFDLSNIDVQTNPLIDYNLDIVRDSIGTPFEFDKLNLDFVPTPELAIVESESKFEKNEYEKGYYAQYKYKLENLSTRSNAERIIVDLDMISNFNNNLEHDTLNVIEKDNSISLQKEFDTKVLSTENLLNLVVDPLKQQNELFTFNNHFINKLSVREDTTKPWLVAYADSSELRNNDYVVERPKFVIELYDKSPLEVLKNDVIFVRINRKVILNPTTDSFNFEILNKGDLKAKLSFIANFNLDIGDNSLQVIGKDATGNYADTLDLHLFVSNNYEITRLINYPNPFENYTTFKFDYVGKENNVDIQITIYDAIGNKIQTLIRKAKFGKNEFLWDSKDDYDRPISIGAYYYRLDILNNYSEPKFGKMIKVN